MICLELELCTLKCHRSGDLVDVASELDSLLPCPDNDELDALDDPFPQVCFLVGTIITVSHISYFWVEGGAKSPTLNLGL